jgi:hypothetical protein
MIDPEVTRLRRLRNTALRARAIALALSAGRPGNDSRNANDSVFSRSALACWRIARVITGTLRAHPYQSYQREAGYWRSLYDRALAALIDAAARLRGGSFGRYSAQLQRVARELDDARALTWSPALSDAFGRSQSEIRALVKELAAGVRQEAVARQEAGAQRQKTATREDPGLQSGPSIRLEAGGGREASQVATHWPYLAF